ncbi:protein-tyrosine phosphatase family protein [Chamaesiphon polymorphus]|uniref:Protein phosphatase n=1 Tax=Chamaesiphon polymorphus CCALA 037 TaxID=2107692 RepID=A0A2T1GG95_9CYAN|nr:dual specificity protein phosphatase family protein [Chamaesiphon polymorphus]PSB56661.1 protein phosphatase [Chamaesiphon polymorphus CCALA 037]
MYKFAAASTEERIVFGSARPGYTDDRVNEWIEFMQMQNIQRVCCLLPKSHLNRYSNLLDTYRQIWGENAICWAPIEDFCLVESEVLSARILPFLATADRHQERVVIHCSGGVGRTGHILAAWLIAGRGFDRQSAIESVKKTGKNPYEAVIAAPFKGRNPWRVLTKLYLLLDNCRNFNNSSS